MRAKKVAIEFLQAVFKRGVVFLSKNDQIFISIIGNIPENFTFSLRVNPYKDSVAFIKIGSHLEVYDSEDCNLQLIVKNPHSAFLMFSGLLPVHEAFAQNRISLKGDIAYALIITEAIYRLQYVIFPSVISNRLLKEPYKDKKTGLFVKFYTYGIIKG